MALNENRLDVAERILKPHLKEDPFDVAAIRMLAELAARIGRWRDAENLLRRAVELAPGLTAARANLALVLGRMGRPAEALELLDEVFAAEPTSSGIWNLKAATLGRLGDFDEAIELYERRAASAPEPAAGVAELRPYAEDRRAAGRSGIAAYRRAIALEPTLGEAWWSLANLKTVKFDDADIAAMEQALATPEPRRTRTASTSTSRSARRCTMRAARTRRSPIMRAANALRLKQQPYRRRRDHRSSSTGASQLFTAEVFAERAGRLRGARPDLHRRHAARGLDADRADPVAATAWSRARPSFPDMPALAREAGTLSERRRSSLTRDERASAGRGISEARTASSGGPTGPSSSTSCPTTGCSCPSST